MLSLENYETPQEYKIKMKSGLRTEEIIFLFWDFGETYKDSCLVHKRSWRITCRSIIHEAMRIFTISKAQNRNKEERIGIFKEHTKNVSPK